MTVCCQVLWPWETFTLDPEVICQSVDSNCLQIKMWGLHSCWLNDWTQKGIAHKTELNVFHLKYVFHLLEQILHLSLRHWSFFCCKVLCLKANFWLVCIFKSNGGAIAVTQQQQSDRVDASSDSPNAVHTFYADPGLIFPFWYWLKDSNYAQVFLTCQSHTNVQSILKTWIF